MLKRFTETVQGVAVALMLLVGGWLAVHGLALEFGTARAQTGNPARFVVPYNAYDVTSTTFVFTSAGGAGAEDGWVTVQGEINKMVQIDIVAIAATSLDFVIQGRLRGTPDGLARQIWPASGNFSFTATGGTTVLIPDPVYQLRIGVKVTGDAGVQDLNVTYNSTP